VPFPESVVPHLQDGDVHYWRVQAITPTGIQTLGVRSFTVQRITRLLGPPDNLILSVTANNELVNQIEFTWSEVTEATNYTLTISGPNDPDFTHALFSMDVQAPNAPFPNVISLLQDGAVYYWRVQAATPAGIQTLGVRKFTVQRVP
jgi:hypothetical protein